MRLPFSTDQFLALFRDYNLAIWPAPVALVLLMASLAWIAARGGGRWHRWGIPAGLIALWIWTGGVYHIGFFSRINPAARLFGVAFLLQAVTWLGWAWRTRTLSFRPPHGPRAAIGWMLLGYALIAYPLLNVALGHAYPSMPTFGAPCPTVIATFALLCWASPRPPWVVWLVPVGWAAVATSAAFTLGIREDLGLPVAAVLALAAQFGSRPGLDRRH